MHKDIESLYKELGSHRKVAEKLGVAKSTVWERLKKAKESGDRVIGDGVSIPSLPSDNLPIDERIEILCRKFEAKKRAYDLNTWFPVTVHDSLPVGICMVGDPHLDNSGANWPLLREHAKLISQTSGLYAVNIGDTTDNWNGSLARLYANNHVSVKEARELIEWFMHGSGIPWIVWLAGNHDCLLPETEVLTKRGFVRFPDILPTDMVLGHSNGEAAWQPINEIVKYDYSGPMAHYKTRGISISCTPNHRFYCAPNRADKWEFRYQHDLPKEFSVITAGSNTLPDCSISDSDIKLAAWILTDGRVNQHGYISLYQSKPSTVREIRELLVGISHSEKCRDRAPKEICGKTLKSSLPAYEWHIHADASRSLHRLVKDRSVVPEWVWNLSDRQLDIFMSTVCRANGSIRKGDDPIRSGWAVHGQIEFLDSLQTLLVERGWQTSTYQDTRGGWRLNVNKKTTHGVVQSPSYTHYEGDVWCLRVPTGNFMMRQDGKCHFTGNSWGDGGAILQLLAKKYDTKSVIAHEWEARFKLVFPHAGGKEYLLNCAHNFSGNSMWNPLHGLAKAALLKEDADIVACGHLHNYAYSTFENANRGKVQHLLRVRGYKYMDSYARGIGMHEQEYGASAVFVFDPWNPDKAGQLMFFPSVEAGADYLTFIRKKRDGASQARNAPRNSKR